MEISTRHFKCYRCFTLRIIYILLVKTALAHHKYCTFRKSMVVLTGLWSCVCCTVLKYISHIDLCFCSKS